MKPLLLILLLITVAESAWAEVPDSLAIRAIIGEDSSCYRGMNAVAHAIRNKGDLKGVYGLNAVRPTKQGLKRFKRDGSVVETIAPELYQMAFEAWSDSGHEQDPTHGATHWEGTKFPKPYWVSGMNYCGTFGDNHFYKEVTS